MEAVDAIGSIGKVINQINDISNTIASAVEEQSATTNEISRNVEEASRGSREIAQNISSVAQAAQRTADGGKQAYTAAEKLSRLAVDLERVVDQFRYSKQARPDEFFDSAHARAGNVPDSIASTLAVASSDAREALDNAIAAHGQWKARRLAQALGTGKLETPVATIRTDNQCAFGKWLHGGSVSHADSPYYKTTKDLHAEFHQTAARVAELAMGGRKAEAEKLMAVDGEYANISGKLTSALLGWKRSLDEHAFSAVRQTGIDGLTRSSELRGSNTR
jgi:methyl-accepting chemotaxis protein